MSNIKKKQLLTLAVVTALMNTGYGVGYAEEAQVEENQVVEAQASEPAQQVQTRDVVVTASRTEQLIKDTPASVEVVTREDIEKMGAENLAQALKLATGINIMENGMVGQQVSLRGMKTNQTLIMIDGRRIRTEETDQTANYYELQRIDMNNVERVEIVRGATSSLYGADAMGGVINIITRTPDKEQISVSGDWTSKQSDVGFRYASGKLDRWDFSLSYKHAKYRQLNTDSSSVGTSKGSGIPNFMGGVTNYTKVENTSTNSSNMYGDKHYFNFKADYDFDKSKKLTLFFDYMREGLKSQENSTGTSTYTFPGMVLTPIHMLYNNKKPSKVVSVDNNQSKNVYYDNVKMGGGITYSGKDSKGNYKISYSYEELKKDQDTYTDNKLSDHDTMKFSQNVLDGQRTMQLGDKNILTYGAEYRTQGLDSTRIGNGELGTDKVPSYKSTNYWAAYVQDEYMPDDRWILIPSLRYDHNDQFGGKFTYKFGTTYKMSDVSRLKFNIGTSYRAPNLSELYMNWHKNPAGNMQVYIKGNANLKPESATNFDISLETENGKNSSKFTYYINKVKNLIDSDTVAAGNNVYNANYINVGKATIQGIELDTTQKFDEHFSLRGTYNYIDAKDDVEDTRLEGRARHTTSLQLQYSNAKSGVNATLWNDWYADYLYASSAHGSNGSSKMDYSGSSLNFVISKKLSNDSNVYFGIDNILKTDTEVLGLSGRVWRAGFNWNF